MEAKTRIGIDFPIEVKREFGVDLVYNNISSYISDELEKCFYGSGELEAMNDKISNLIETLSNIITFLFKVKIICIEDIPLLLGTTDEIYKLK